MLEIRRWGQNLAFFWFSTPSRLKSSTRPHKGSVEPSLIFVRLSVRARAKKNAKKKKNKTNKKQTKRHTKTFYFASVWGRPRATDCYDFWHSPGSGRRNQTCKLLYRSVSDLARVKVGGLPYKKLQRPLLYCVLH